MTGDDRFQLVFLLLTITLPLSALLSRRMPIRRAIPMGLAWAAIIAGVVLVIGLVRDNGLRANIARISSLLSDDEQRVSGKTVRIRMAPDGHFWATAAINGVQRRMLIDSGATQTALSLDTARAARLDLNQSPFPVIIETANGKVAAQTSSIGRLQLGTIDAQDLRVTVAPEFGDTDVLGMNFLSRLASWHVEGDILVLEPKA